MLRCVRSMCCIRNHRRDRSDTEPDDEEESPPMIVRGGSMNSVRSSTWGSAWNRVSSSVYEKVSRWSSYGDKKVLRDRDEATRRFDKYMCLDSTIDEFIHDDDGGGDGMV